MFSIYEASRKLPILLTFVTDDDRYLELRMRYEDSRKKLLGIIAKKGVTLEDREKLMLIVSKAFDKLFWTSQKIIIELISCFFGENKFL
jgi:hypothetical protein